MALLVLAVAAVISATVVAGATGGGGRPRRWFSHQPATDALDLAASDTDHPPARRDPWQRAGGVHHQDRPRPIQVQVLAEPECVGYAGEGWHVRHRITNDGPLRSGPVGAAIDNAVPQVINPNLTLRRGGRLEDVAVVLGGGDGLVVSWMGVSASP